MKSWPFAVAALLVGAALAFTESRERSPERALQNPLRDFPESLQGRWRTIRELPLSQGELDLLKLSDHVSRAYMATTPEKGLVTLYIGYYQSQRTGATYHSPLNCLPGTGYQIVSIDLVGVPGASGRQVKRLVMQRDMRHDVVLYWYHDRGRVITSEWTAKAWLIWDGFRANRTDGSLVRIIAPVYTTTEEATERALRFLGDLWPTLEERLSERAGA